MSLNQEKEQLPWISFSKNHPLKVHRNGNNIIHVDILGPCQPLDVAIRFADENGYTLFQLSVMDSIKLTWECKDVVRYDHEASVNMNCSHLGNDNNMYTVVKTMSSVEVRLNGIMAANHWFSKGDGPCYYVIPSLISMATTTEGATLHYKRRSGDEVLPNPGRRKLVFNFVHQIL